MAPEPILPDNNPWAIALMIGVAVLLMVVLPIAAGLHLRRRGQSTASIVVPVVMALVPGVGALAWLVATSSRNGRTTIAAS